MAFSNLSQYRQFFSRLIALERDEEINRHIQEIKKLTGQQREKSGRTIMKLSARDAGRGLGGSWLIKYVRHGGELPETELSPGDLAIISKGNPDGKEPQGTVLEKSRRSITLAFRKKPPKYAWQKGLRIDLFANDIPFQRMQEALDKLVEETPLVKMLLGKTVPSTRENEHTPSFYNTNLNASQKEAVRLSLAANQVFLVHGPPGTGKTTTLIEAIQQHISKEDRVLATADSNTAVDNLVEKLHQQNVDVLRIGNPAKINQELLEHSLDYLLQDEPDFQNAARLWEQVDTWKEQQKNHTPANGKNRRGMTDKEIHQNAAKGKRTRGVPPKKIQDMAKWLNLQDQINRCAEKAKKLEDKATRTLMAHADVICCTNSTAGSDLMTNWFFDTVFIDEATQATEPSCLISMGKGEKYIMAGDHHQLPPTILNGEAAPWLKKTLFERLLGIYGSRISSLLNIQYRMHGDLMAFPNKMFYEGALQAHENVKDHTIRALLFSSEQEQISNNAKNDEQEKLLEQAAQPENIAVFLDTGTGAEEYQAKDSTSYRNKTEVNIVEKVLKKLLEKGLQPKDIGIITPYNGQADLLKNRLQDHKGLEIKSVDGYQGKEKEVILLSFVRSNDHGDLGFLTDYRRLNVAVTRARRKLIMTGNADLLRTNNTYRMLLESVTVLPAVLAGETALNGPF